MPKGKKMMENCTTSKIAPVTKTRYAYYLPKLWQHNKLYLLDLKIKQIQVIMKSYLRLHRK